jgi:hypothetical protein
MLQDLSLSDKEEYQKTDKGYTIIHQVHNLNSQQLAAREVEIIDIASISRDYWSKVISAPNVDLTTFKSQRTERGPLLKGWMVCSRSVIHLLFPRLVCSGA